MKGMLLFSRSGCFGFWNEMNFMNVSDKFKDIMKEICCKILFVISLVV